MKEQELSTFQVMNYLDLRRHLSSKVFYLSICITEEETKIKKGKKDTKDLDEMKKTMIEHMEEVARIEKLLERYGHFVY